MNSSLGWFANLEIFQQQNCIICQQQSRALICPYCTEDLPLFDLHLCQYNLLNIPGVKSGLKNIEFTHLLALTDYQWPLAKLLRELKFSAKIQYSKALAELFVSHCLCGSQHYPQAILPMPLHSGRYITRKYNQSIEIAKHISSLSKIPIDLSVIMRHKSTSAQSGLGAAKRRSNLRNAFTLLAPTDYNHIALFDDVITTGATMQAAFQLLKKHYPQMQIDIWSIALTLVHQQNLP